MEDKEKKRKANDLLLPKRLILTCCIVYMNTNILKEKDLYDDQ